MHQRARRNFQRLRRQGLVFCVFFVLFALAWLGAGLASVAILHSSVSMRRTVLPFSLPLPACYCS